MRQDREEPAGSRQAEEIREVVCAFDGARCELRDDGLSVLAGSDERIGEYRPRTADELAHPQAEAAPRAERERSDEAVSPVRDVDGEIGVATVVAPPLDSQAWRRKGSGAASRGRGRPTTRPARRIRPRR